MQGINETLEPRNRRAERFEIFCIICPQGHDDDVGGARDGGGEKPLENVFRCSTTFADRAPGDTPLGGVMESERKLWNEPLKGVIDPHPSNGGIPHAKNR
jgi:hypothetical protein